MKTLLQRLDELVSIVPITGCWMWMGGINRNGYGRTKYRSVGMAAHRAVYMATTGTMLERSVDVDHKCRNRWCVNPDHMEAVSRRENVLRGIGRSAENARKDVCYRGHPLSGDNLRLERRSDGNPRLARRCRECQRILARSRYVPAPKRKKAKRGGRRK